MVFEKSGNEPHRPLCCGCSAAQLNWQIRFLADLPDTASQHLRVFFMRVYLAIHFLFINDNYVLKIITARLMNI